MIVEDERKVAEIVARGLRAERFAVDLAEDGPAALEMRAACAYDLVILEHVWDPSFEGLTNIVDVYVRHLRAKVDDPFPVKLIQTVRGVGYCLNDEPRS